MRRPQARAPKRSPATSKGARSGPDGRPRAYASLTSRLPSPGSDQCDPVFGRLLPFIPSIQQLELPPLGERPPLPERAVLITLSPSASGALAPLAKPWIITEPARGRADSAARQPNSAAGPRALGARRPPGRGGLHDRTP